MKALNSPVVRQRVRALLDGAERPRWDVVFTRLAFALGLIAGLGSVSVLFVTVSGVVPGRGGAILAGAGGAVGALCTTAAALGPRMTRAAGICRAAQEGGVPFLDVLPDVLKTLADAPRIVRQAAEQARADATAAELERSREAEAASRAAIVNEVVGQVATLIGQSDKDRSKSFIATAAGLVEAGVLAGPETEADGAPAPAAVTGTETVPVSLTTGRAPGDPA